MTADPEMALEAIAILNGTVLLPGGTVTKEGTVAEALLLFRVTIAPPCGAGLLNMTVPVEELPAAMLAGFTAIDAIAVPSLGEIDKVTVEFALMATLSWNCPP